MAPFSLKALQMATGSPMRSSVTPLSEAKPRPCRQLKSSQRDHKAFGANVAQDHPTQEDSGKYVTCSILLQSQLPLLQLHTWAFDASLPAALEMLVNWGLRNLFSLHLPPALDFSGLLSEQNLTFYRTFSPIF